MVDGAAHKRSSFFRRLIHGPFPWLAPLALVLLALFVYPTFEVIRYSFTDASIISSDYSYTLKSYQVIFTNPNTRVILTTTLIFVFFSVVFQTLLGLVIALAVDKGESLKIHGTVFVRVATLLSWAIPGSIVGVIWKLMYNETATGILSSILRSMGITNITFLTTPFTALVCVIVANIWRGSAQSMILTYSGLKTIPGDIIEAAHIDGAGAWQRLRHVILPSITPVISINVVLNTILTFNTFDMVLSLTGGGPGRSTEILALTSYNSIFTSHYLGRGSAYAALLLLINAGMGLVYFHFLKRREEIE